MQYELELRPLLCLVAADWCRVRTSRRSGELRGSAAASSQLDRGRYPGHFSPVERVKALLLLLTGRRDIIIRLAVKPQSFPNLMM